MRKLLARKQQLTQEDGEIQIKDVKRSWSSVFKLQSSSKLERQVVDETRIENNYSRGNDTTAKIADEADDRSWDSAPMIANSISTVGSSATISTLKHFGLSNHPGKGADDVTIDAFMDIKSEKVKSRSRGLLKSVKRKAHAIESQHAAAHSTALSCIAKRDFNYLLSIVKSAPEILLYQCRGSGSTREGLGQHLDERSNLHGCNGGTLLHVLVSQRPALKKKRVKNTNSMKSRVTTVLSTGIRSSYELHIMPSVPDSILTYIIKKEPKALQMIDDYGRLPIHCATLSLSAHFEQVNKLYGGSELSQTGKGVHDISQFIVREINVIHLLLKYYREAGMVADYKGNLPIHYAASIGPDYYQSNKVSFLKANKYTKPSAAETVKQLLEAHPRSVRVENIEGNLPIHIICTQGPDINCSSLKHIMTYHSACREVLIERNKYSDPPLFVAIRSRAVVDVIRMFASTDEGTIGPTRLFAQRDGNSNNPLHVALRMTPAVDPAILRTIISLAPFTASTPDRTGKMPIRYATDQGLPEDIIRQMLARDMPIEIGTDINSDKQTSGKSVSGLARHVVGRSHHHSWWHILIDCDDEYLSMVQSFLSKEATHAQIITLARQVGPDGISTLINCVSDNCRMLFHTLLRFYDRYEILLSSKYNSVKPDELIDGIETFLALDHGLSTELPEKENYAKLCISASNLSIASENTISTAVRVRSEKKSDSEVEVTLISKEKSRVVLRCYQHEEAFFAEVKVREKYEFPRQYFEELYNYHRDETYTYLTLSKAEKLCCITFEAPDHTLAEVFASVSSGGQRSQKWIEKCWIVLKQIATSLKYLHNQDLIHGHLDAPNIAKYGNTWKIGKLGTLTKIGTTMRGTFRACVPPESITKSLSSSGHPASPRSFRTRSEPIRTNNVPTSTPRVKFSHSIEEGEMEKVKKNEAECRDELISCPPSPEIDVRQGSERNDLLSFFGFSSNNSSLDMGKQGKSTTPKERTSTLKRFKGEVFGKAVFVPERCTATPQWDMWGFGLVMVQILLGRCMLLPNFEQAEDAMLKNLLQYDEKKLKLIRNQVNAVAGRDATDLITMLLQKDPERRPKSMEEILAHKYFQVLTIYV